VARLSLLVPEAYYAQVAAWAERTHLGARLVYYRVRPQVASQPPTLHSQSLAHRLAIEPASPFYNWIAYELARRFDYACCENMDQFRREQRAITRNGQRKAGGERHEKDDRRTIDDRTTYVFGWSNDAKIAALTRQEHDVATRISAHAAQIVTLKREVQDDNRVYGLWLDAEVRKIGRLRDTIISAMQDYVRTWPLDAREVDVSIDAAAEFQCMLHVLEADDLSRFADKFKGLLNEDTIREIAGFQSQLKRERETLCERVDIINASLHAIHYNPNRYIALEAAPSLDADLRDFQQDLRRCTEGSLTGSADEGYTEAKFLQVRRIIERFRGREWTPASWDATPSRLRR
jgi:uncharacterized protein YPO0396